MISFFYGIFNIIKTVAKAKKKGESIKKYLKGLIIKTLLPTFIEILALIILLVTVYYSMTGAVDEMFNKLQKMFGKSSQVTSEFLDGLSDKEINELIDDTGSALNPKKIKSYMQKESESFINSNYSENKITETYKNDKLEKTDEKSVTVDTSKYTNLYKINWQFLASVDIVKYDSEEVDNSSTINTASSLYSTFTWKKGYTKDDESYIKSWTKKVEKDSSTGKSTVLEDTSKNATIKKTVVKTPIAVPDIINTAFGDYKYSVKENVVTSEGGWSKATIVKEKSTSKTVQDGYEDDKTKPISREIRETRLVNYYDHSASYKFDDYESFGVKEGHTYKYSSKTSKYYIYKDNSKESKGQIYIETSLYDYDDMPLYLLYDNVVVDTIFTGRYEKKAKYKEIVTTTYEYQSTKTKTIEDIVNLPTFTFNPSKFLGFIKQNGLNGDDLELMVDVLTSMPSTSALTDNVKKVIAGNYGDALNGIGSSGSTFTSLDGGFNTVIPLFIQWDERWKNHPYSAETVGIAGCGITSMSMVVTGLGANISPLSQYDYNKNNILEPNEMADISTARGHSTNGQGTMQSLYKDVGELLGLKVTATSDYSQAYNALKEAKVVIGSFGPGHFTNGSHLMVLTGTDSTGKVYINDPYSKDNSAKSWDSSIIESESSMYFIFDNPNFVTEEFEATAYYSYTFEAAAAIGTEEAYAEALMQGGSETTASGLNVGDKDLRDKIIAVDRNMIPLKTKVMISVPDVATMTMPDGKVVSLAGWYSAEDTGGAINQKKIDIYMGAYGKSPQYKDLALQFGRRKIIVKRLKSN